VPTVTAPTATAPTAEAPVEPEVVLAPKPEAELAVIGSSDSSSSSSKRPMDAATEAEMRAELKGMFKELKRKRQIAAATAAAPAVVPCFNSRILSWRSVFVGTPVHCDGANAVPLAYWQRYTEVCTLLDKFATFSAVVSVHRSSDNCVRTQAQFGVSPVTAAVHNRSALYHAHFSLVTQPLNVFNFLLHGVYC
jgi:hypothetical protein